MVTHDLALAPSCPASWPTAQRAHHRLFVMLFDEAHLANDSLLRVKHGAEAFVPPSWAPGTPAACS